MDTDWLINLKTSMIGRLAVSAAVFAAAGLLVGACGGKGTASASAGCTTIAAKVAAPGGSATSGSWPYSNVDLANTRDATGSKVSSANVSKLAQAWTFKLTGKAAAGVRPFGSLTANPIVQNGTVYLQDLDSNVYALALGTGKLEWEYRCNQPEKSGPGPNGVAVADGRVYGLTPTAAFALNATTGKTIWVNAKLLNTGQGTFGIQPQVTDGRVYLASQLGSGPGGGVLMALNASNGALQWRFNTVVGPEPGVQSLGVGAGGAWETPLVSADGSVTYGTGNPYQTAAAAIAHPAVDLYTDSDVNLNAATGKLRWYYQGVPNDFKDYDMQTSPIATRVGGVSVVIGSGKMGYVYEMNASTGKLIWKTPVGAHNGHDNDSLLALEHKLKLKAPFTLDPGPLGGVLTDVAVASDSVYVATLDVPVTYTTLSLAKATGAGSATGEVEALSLATGKVQWDTKVPELPLGAATVSNDLVFTTLYDGVLIALNRSTGAIVYRHRLPTSANSPIAIAGNTVIVPAGGPITSAKGGGGDPQVVAYTIP
ncbi:MAG TPA: PQQ-binding-like beta-propeller repeat protein [Solirubrobacteraceae bacterium]|nr:PQQ-binding-like beta-propeller repeat protein [Solirubrobacteraceae bacterium]